MITTTAMRQLIAAVLEKDIDAATHALLSVGVIDFIDIREIHADWTSQLKSMPGSEDAEKVKDLRRRLDAYINTAGSTPAELLRSDVVPGGGINISEAERILNELGNSIRRVRDRQKEAQDEILRLQELRRQLPQQNSINPALLSGGHKYISVHSGVIPLEMRSSFEEALRDFPAVYLPGGEGGQNTDFLITLRRDKDLSLIHI